MSSEPKTLFEKVWNQHVVVAPEGEPTIVYIDLQLLHEVTSPQAFEGLRLAGRKVRCPDRCVATVDHNVPRNASCVAGTAPSRLMATREKPVVRTRSARGRSIIVP